MNTALIEHGGATQAARAMFGDLAIKAYAMGMGSTPEEAEVDAAYCWKDPRDLHLPTASSVAILFSNGRLVAFGTSEWGSIDPVPEHALCQPPLPPEPKAYPPPRDWPYLYPDNTPMRAGDRVGVTMPQGYRIGYLADGASDLEVRWVPTGSDEVGALMLASWKKL